MQTTPRPDSLQPAHGHEHFHEDSSEYLPTEDGYQDEDESDLESAHAGLPPDIRHEHYNRSRHIDYHYHLRHPTPSPSSLDPQEELGGPYGPPQFQGVQGRGGPARRAMQHYPQPRGFYAGNPQMHPGGYNGYHPQGGNGHFYPPHDGMPMYGNEMMGYGHGPQYYRAGPNPAALPGYMQGMHLGQPGGQRADQQGNALTPGPDATNKERERLQAEIDRMKAEREESKEREKMRELEARAIQKAEQDLQKKYEDMKKKEEEHRQELERTRAEADRRAREQIEIERKAEERRAKQREDDIRKAEEKAMLKFETEMKAVEDKRRREEEERARADAAFKLKVEATVRAEEEKKKAAAKEAKEAAERQKLWEEEAKKQAEKDAAAKVEKEKEAAQKKAEADAAAKQEHEAYTKKVQEETKAKLEEAARSNADKAPIKFKDALGRKFNFPFHICCRWQGMEELIKQAFMVHDPLGPQVHEGFYDLLGPDGEIILPAVWERTIQPDWSITMELWHADRFPPRFRAMGGFKPGHGIPIPPNMRPLRNPSGRGRGGVRNSFVAPNIEVLDDSGPSQGGKDGKAKRSFAKEFFMGKPKAK